MDAIPVEITNVLSQFPMLLVFLVIWWQQMRAHQEAIAYYRQQQQRYNEWMQRLFEVWSAEELKKSEPSLTNDKPGIQKAP